MSCLTLQVSTSTRDSRYGTIDKRMSTPCLSSYYTLPPHFEPSDDCVACPSYYDSPIPLCENVYSLIMPFVTRRVQCESLTLLRKLMISPKLHQFNVTDVGVELAIGSSGTVVLAKMPSESSHDFEQIAIKLFNPLQPLQPEEEYFQQHAYEIYIACMMEHENIVHAHRATYQERQLGLFMEYCPHDFFNLISSDTLTPSQIDNFFYQMVSGVRFLHRNGIAHRDLKLDNFMVTAEGTLKIVDFGFACITRTAGRDTPLLSQGLWGSDPYMAPEIFTGSEYDAEKADVWSLGIIYLACCINRFPWEVATEEDFHYAQYLIDPLSLAKIIPNSASINLILQMLEPNPTKRISIGDVYSDPWFASIMTSHLESKLCKKPNPLFISSEPSFTLSLP